MKNDKIKLWAEYSPSEFYDSILKRNDDSPSIAYYLINSRLKSMFRVTFLNVGAGNYCEFQDTLEDFFLYLHDGSNWLYERPFYMLDGVEDKRALFKWMGVTYRNFLIRMLNEDLKSRAAALETEYDEIDVPDDKKVMYLSTAIAYADQKAVSRGRFVMYRLLLSFLNHSLAVPQEDMATAVDMKPVAYRVSTKRMKDSMINYIRCLEQGGTLDLDDEHVVMRDRLLENFDDLYTTLSSYYEKAIDSLPSAEAIRRLRLSHSIDGAPMCHEETVPYSSCYEYGGSLFYVKFKDFCKKKSDSVY